MISSISSVSSNPPPKVKAPEPLAVSNTTTIPPKPDGFVHGQLLVLSSEPARAYQSLERFSIHQPLMGHVPRLEHAHKVLFEKAQLLNAEAMIIHALKPNALTDQLLIDAEAIVWKG